MAAELGTVNLGNVHGVLILRLDDGTEVEVGTLDLPVNVHVAVTLPNAKPNHDVSEGDDVREPEPPAPIPLDGERIEALPVGSVVVDTDGDTYERRSAGWVRTITDGDPSNVILGSAMHAAVVAYSPFTLVSTPVE